MEITLRVEKRTTFILVLLIALFGGLVIVHAFGSGGPASRVGHSSEEGAVPPGAVMFFNLSSCPTGYLEATSVSGRTIVGMPTAGTLEGTTGTALTNLENRAVGAHGHSVSDPGHGHSTSFSDGGHSHTATSIVTDPGHAHPFGCQSSGVGTIPFAGSTGPTATCGTSSATTGVSVSTSTALSVTGISVGVNSAGTGISIGTTGAVAGTNSPYVQYLACVKL